MNEQNRNGELVAALIVLGVLVLLSVLSVPAMVGMMGAWAGNGGMMAGGYWWGWLVMLLFWALLIGGAALVAVWLFRQGRMGAGHVSDSGPKNDAGDANDGSANNGSTSALDILKKRYARGEITKKAYEQMKRDILAD